MFARALSTSRQASHVYRTKLRCGWPSTPRCGPASVIGKVRLKADIATSSTSPEASTSSSDAASTSQASSSSVDAKSADAKAKPKETGTLPYLPRPLGVREPPTTTRKSWREQTMELMDQDVRLARRKHMYVYSHMVEVTD